MFKLKFKNYKFKEEKGGNKPVTNENKKLCNKREHKIRTVCLNDISA
jgi:hypothetical protein